MAVESGYAGAAFGCVRAWEVAVKSGSGACEVAGDLGYAGVALEERAGLKRPIRLSRGRPGRSQGDRGRWESRMGVLRSDRGVSVIG